MLEWLKKLLIDEEVEVEEEKLEKIDFTKVHNIDTIMNDKPQEEKKETEKKVEETPTPIKKEFNIQLTETPKKHETKVEYKSKRIERHERSQEKKDIEISQVISPMFGGGEIKKNETMTKTTHGTKKKDGLGTVISPIYGQAELLNHEKEAQSKIEESQLKSEPILEEDDWKNDIPLEELISDEKENTDCVQFSLFGDNQTINE